MLVHRRVKDPEWCVSENGIWKTPAYHVTTEHDDKPLDSGDSLFSAQSQVVAVGC